MPAPSATPEDLFGDNEKQADYVAQAYATGSDETISDALMQIAFVRHPLVNFFREVKSAQE